MNEGWLALLQQALSLLFSLDPEVWSIVSVSFSVSFAALVITLLPSLILGFVLAFGRFPGRWLITNLIQTLQSNPTIYPHCGHRFTRLPDANPYGASG